MVTPTRHRKDDVIVMDDIQHTDYKKSHHHRRHSSTVNGSSGGGSSGSNSGGTMDGFHSQSRSSGQAASAGGGGHGYTNMGHTPAGSAGPEKEKKASRIGKLPGPPGGLERNLVPQESSTAAPTPPAKKVGCYFHSSYGSILLGICFYFSFL